MRFNCTESKELLGQFVASELPEDQFRAVDMHVRGCRECRELHRGLEWQQLAKQALSGDAGPGHISDFLLVEFTDASDEFNEDQIEWVWAHLDQCDECMTAYEAVQDDRPLHAKPAESSASDESKESEEIGPRSEPHAPLDSGRADTTGRPTVQPPKLEMEENAPPSSVWSEPGPDQEPDLDDDMDDEAEDDIESDNDLPVAHVEQPKPEPGPGSGPRSKEPKWRGPDPTPKVEKPKAARPKPKPQPRRTPRSSNPLGRFFRKLGTLPPTLRYGALAAVVLGVAAFFVPSMLVSTGVVQGRLPARIASADVFATATPLQEIPVTRGSRTSSGNDAMVNVGGLDEIVVVFDLDFLNGGDDLATYEAALYNFADQKVWHGRVPDDQIHDGRLLLRLSPGYLDAGNYRMELIAETENETERVVARSSFEILK